MKKQLSHGEMNFFEFSGSIPADAEALKPVGGRYVIAKSSVTGNDHCIESKKGVEISQKNGVFYVKNSVPVAAFCLLKDRHDNITLAPGQWEIEAAKEFDYYDMQKRAVAD